MTAIQSFRNKQTQKSQKETKESTQGTLYLSNNYIAVS